MKKVGLRLIKLYQGLKPLRGQILRTLLGNDRTCRFYPTCSDYTAQAIKKHGVIVGTVLGMWRIMRCNPLGGHGYDPVK